MRSRLSVLASIAIALTLQLRPAAAETDRPGDEARLRSEATAFFAAVLPDLDLGRAPCAVAAEWADYPVPAALLDVNAHAELVPPPHETRPAEILDPDGRDPAWFCTRPEVDALVLATAQRLAPEPAGTRAELAGFELTFPIFSEPFDRAVIVLVDWQIWLSRPADGTAPLAGGQAGSGVALVYERRGDGWVRVGTHDLFAYEALYTPPEVGREGAG